MKYLMLGHYESAAEEFEQALRIRPDAAQPLSNLGLALHGLGRYQEAERLIRRSLQLRPRAVKSRYALALVLLAEGEQDEALELLGEVAGQIPEAHVHAAVLLDRRADYQGAAREIRAYLNTDHTKHRETAQHWLSRLQSRLDTHATSKVD